MLILEGQTLEMYNVLSYRAKLTQQQMAMKIKELDEKLREKGVKRTANPVTTTYSVEEGIHGPIMDVEFLLPLDQKVTLPEGCVWKSHFLLTNALVARHTGNPDNIQLTINALNAYMAEQHLIPITSGYNVTVKGAKTSLELNEMIVDIYVGINPNIL